MLTNDKIRFYTPPWLGEKMVLYYKCITGDDCSLYIHTCFSACHVSITMRVVSSPSTVSVLSYISSEKEKTETYDKIKIHIYKIIYKKWLLLSWFQDPASNLLFHTNLITFRVPIICFKQMKSLIRPQGILTQKHLLFIPDFLEKCFIFHFHV